MRPRLDEALLREGLQVADLQHLQAEYVGGTVREIDGAYTFCQQPALIARCRTKGWEGAADKHPDTPSSLA
jgi:hypothetical protein